MSLDFVLNKFRLIGIFGQRGSGKTALATYFIRLLSEMLGLPVVANYHINLPGACVYDVSELVSREFVDRVIGADEIISNADSRLSLSMQNIYYSYFISQIRKSPHEDGSRGLGNFCVYTAQLQSMADIRVFEQTSLYVMMEQLASGDFSMEWQMQDGSEGDGVIPFSFFKREVFDKKLYSTDEKVMPLAIESMTVEMEKFLPVKYNLRVNNAVESILKEKGWSWQSWKDVKQFTVRDWLVDNGVPERLALPVFNRVCERVRLQGLKK